MGGTKPIGVSLKHEDGVFVTLRLLAFFREVSPKPRSLVSSYSIRLKYV